MTMHVAGDPLRDKQSSSSPAWSTTTLSAPGHAYGANVKVLALTIPEREAILAALDDPPRGLEHLKAFCLPSMSGASVTG